MAKSTYHIAYVERGMEPLWRQYWVTNDHSDEVVKAARAILVGSNSFRRAASTKRSRWFG